jgi:hypothetical protein
VLRLPRAAGQGDHEPRQRKDIHTYGFYLQHADNCYDREIKKQYAKYHPDKDAARARRPVAGWRVPVDIDH